MNSIAPIFCLVFACVTLASGENDPVRALPFDGKEAGREGPSRQRLDVRVSTVGELVAALSRAAPDSRIHIDGRAVLDLGPVLPVVIPSGTMLTSDRGVGNSPGALLFTTRLDAFPMLVTGGSSVSIGGLRLRGPDPERRTNEMARLIKMGGRSPENGYYSIANSSGVKVVHSEFLMHHCEVFGWSHSGVYVVNSSPAVIRDCDFHHCQRSGLGYGVCLARGVLLVERSRFDWCRHAIASTGQRDSSYEARYNWVGENFSGHVFDVHGGGDRDDGTDVAGGATKIHHNTVECSKYPSVFIRGVPAEASSVRWNYFSGENPVKQTGSGRLDVRDNMSLKSEKRK